MKRREILQKLALAPLLMGAQYFPHLSNNYSKSKARVQYSVNAYSFNDMFRSGEMSFFEMMEYAADIGLDAVDLTGYYFSSYPAIPPNAELYKLKRHALSLGLDISWTGVRNNFVNPDEKARETDRELIKDWLQVSAKLGAPLMRIFAGKGKHDGYSRDEVKTWLVEELKVCASYGQETGVLPALQHHNDFLFKSDEVIDILKRVDSDWLGLILDVGSLRASDPYAEIEKLAPYADYWFIKEHVYPSGKAVPVDMAKVAAIIKKSGYQGYVSFESLSEGDPKEIVADMFEAFRKEYERS